MARGVRRSGKEAGWRLRTRPFQAEPQLRQSMLLRLSSELAAKCYPDLQH